MSVPRLVVCFVECLGGPCFHNFAEAIPEAEFLHNQVEANLRLWRMLHELQEREQQAQQAHAGRDSYGGLGHVMDDDM
jgi:hypothetical protein